VKVFNLLIDCRLRNSTGIGRYIRELVPRVVASLPDFHFGLIGLSGNEYWLQGVLNTNVTLLPVDARVFRAGEQTMFRKILPQTRAVWCPHFCVPWSLPDGVRLVTTVHDLIPWHVARGWKGRMRQIGAWFYLRTARRNSVRVITVSETVKRELVREFAFEVNRICAIPNGVSSVWATAIQESAPPDLRSQRYILYLGNLSAHKNVEGLLDAFAKVVPITPHRLVVVGEWSGFTGHENLQRSIAALGSRVIFAARLTDGELRGLVAGADLLVQPSLEEGFGLPPLEAMMAGTPVLTSNCAALLETAANGAHRFALQKKDDFARQLRLLLADDQLRRSKITEGLTWARQYTWERSAELVVGLLREVLSKP
jgi:glycosyltransferase involved in cell wall biosynthesis